MLLPEPKKIKQLATGTNHILALDEKGKVFAWGCPEQDQLGRRCVQRDLKRSALRPGGVGFKRGTHIKKIACGAYHSFAVDDAGRVFAWGLNNFGELGLQQGAGEADASVLQATLVTALSEYHVVDIAGGAHHSLACTDDGKLLTWGRIDNHQVGLPTETLDKDDILYDERGNPRILAVPTVIPGKPRLPWWLAGVQANPAAKVFCPSSPSRPVRTTASPWPATARSTRGAFRPTTRRA